MILTVDVMNYLLLLTILSSICGIVSFIIGVCSKYTKAKILQWVFIVFVLTFSSGYAVHYNSELERIKNIHRQANAIYGHYNLYGDYKEYIQEVLTFLEENREEYPDSYKRAIQIYDDMKKESIQYACEPAEELRGIIKGIATLNE